MFVNYSQEEKFGIVVLLGYNESNKNFLKNLVFIRNKWI